MKIKRVKIFRIGSRVALEKYVKARLWPLCVLVAITVSLSAPAVFLWLRLREMQAQARVTAHKVGAMIQREKQVLPGLWQYNTLKLVEHLRAYRQRSGVRWIVVTDRRGRPLNLPQDLKRTKDHKTARTVPRLVWSAAPIKRNEVVVGRVWVAVDADRMGGLLFVIFGLLALVLAALVYWIPLRVVRTAENRIRNCVG